MKASLLVALVALSVASVAPRAATAQTRSPVNVLVNGDFREGTLHKSWDALYPGSHGIVGWRILAPVDYVSSAYRQTDRATRSVDLDGTPGPGAIAQTFRTFRGDTYTVRFRVAANTEGPPRLKRMRVSVDGMTLLYTVDSAGRSNAAMGFRQASFSFVARADTATLEFASLSRPGNWNGAVIANVVVTAGPSVSGQTARTRTTAERPAS